MAIRNIREVLPADLDQLHEMIVSSTNSKTKITKTQLYDDLFKIIGPTSVQESCAEVEVDQSTSNVPVCRALVAESREGLLCGYILFNFYYSPWKGHYINLLDIFMRPECRQQGVARRLLGQLAELCEKEGYNDFVYDNSSLSDSLRVFVNKFNPHIVRGEDSDWSVFRVEFDNIMPVNRDKQK